MRYVRQGEVQERNDLPGLLHRERGVILTVQNVYATVEQGLERQVIRKALAYRPKGYNFAPAFQTGRWDGWANMMDGYGRFPAGLLDLAVDALRQENMVVEITDERVRPPPHPALAPASLVNTTLMEHQERAVERAQRAGRGILHHPVAAGKTIVLIELVRRCAVPTLVLTHQKDLLRQLHGEFTSRLDIPGMIGVITGGHWQPGPAVTIATYQSIRAALKNYPDQAKAFLDSIQCVVVDEVHNMAAPTFEKVMAQAKNAFYRFGCSATPHKQGDRETMLKVTGWTGPVVSHYTSTDGVDFGRLVPADVFVVDYGGTELDLPWPAEYEHTVVGHAGRNKAIADIVQAAPKPALVLVTRLLHGAHLRRLLERAGLRVGFISGENRDSVRTWALNALRDEQIEVLVSSVILDEGINLPNVRTLVLAGGGKAEHRIIQRIGRGMRSSDGKARLLVFDWADQGKYTKAHARKRQRLYQSEPAYSVFDCTIDDVKEALSR